MAGTLFGRCLYKITHIKVEVGLIFGLNIFSPILIIGIIWIKISPNLRQFLILEIGLYGSFLFLYNKPLLR